MEVKYYGSQIILVNGTRLWPAKFHPKDSVLATRVENDLDKVKEHLKLEIFNGRVME